LEGRKNTKLFFGVPAEKQRDCGGKTEEFYEILRI
jgi:hypothetical protein